MPLQPLIFSRAESSILLATVDGILYRYTGGTGMGTAGIATDFKLDV
jgi:hypothetical protein